MTEFVRCVGLAACLIGGLLAQAGPATGTAPGDDGEYDRLQGRWIERADGLELNVLFDDGRGVAIAMSKSGRDGFARTGVGHLTAIGADEGGRYFELDPHVAEASGLPRRVGYRFDGDALVLDMAEGLIAGRHVLERDGSGGEPGGGLPIAAGLIAAAVLLIVLIAAAAWLLRRSQVVPRTVPARKPRWRRTRWAAAVLSLAVAYPACLAPVGYAVGRGWIPVAFANVYVAPIEAAVGRPGESAVGRVAGDYARWWMDLGRRHAASD